MIPCVSASPSWRTRRAAACGASTWRTGGWPRQARVGPTTRQPCAPARRDGGCASQAQDDAGHLLALTRAVPDDDAADVDAIAEGMCIERMQQLFSAIARRRREQQQARHLAWLGRRRPRVRRRKRAPLRHLPPRRQRHAAAGAASARPACCCTTRRRSSSSASPSAPAAAGNICCGGPRRRASAPSRPPLRAPESREAPQLPRCCCCYCCYCLTRTRLLPARQQRP